MLHCVYHPVNDMRVVDDEERKNLIESGLWFDTPDEAKALRKKVEKDIELDKKPSEVKNVRKKQQK